MVSPSGPAATTLPAPNAAAVIGNNEIPLFYVHGDNYADRTEPVAAQTFPVLAAQAVYADGLYEYVLLLLWPDGLLASDTARGWLLCRGADCEVIGCARAVPQ